jgi:hypothetical protein
MGSVTKKIAFALASSALLASSTVAVAAAPAAQAAVQTQAPSPWLMLSAMSSTRAIALGGAAAAAQPTDVPPPPPPGYVAGGPAVSGELIGFVVMFALIAIALTISGSSGAGNSPNSPT